MSEESTGSDDESPPLWHYYSLIVAILVAKRVARARRQVGSSTVAPSTIRQSSNRQATRETAGGAAWAAVRLLLVWTILGTYYASALVAERMTLPVGLMPLVGVFQALYLSIYAAKSANLINAGDCGHLLDFTDGMDIIGTFSSPDPREHGLWFVSLLLDRSAVRAG